MEFNIRVSSITDAEHAIEVLRAYVAFFPAAVTSQGDKPKMPRLVADLALSVRTINCLKAEGIHALDQLLTWSGHRLLKIPNLGRKSTNEIIDTLRSLGMQLQP